MTTSKRHFAVTLLIAGLTLPLPAIVSAQSAAKPTAQPAAKPSAQPVSTAAPQAVVQPKPEDWYKRADRRSLMLRDMMLDADQGEVEAMIPVATTLLSGFGRAEGPHPQAAIYWFTTAAERGEHKALEHLAVLYAAGVVVPRDEKKANAYLDAYAAKTGKPLKVEECGDDDACSRYRRLVASHSSTNLEYPRQARIDSLGGEFHVTLSLASREIKVTGAKHLDLFGPPLRKAVETAVKQIPMPAGLAERRKTLVFNYDLRVK